jgi:hypothetical protein
MFGGGAFTEAARKTVTVFPAQRIGADEVVNCCVYGRAAGTAAMSSNTERQSEVRARRMI